MKNLPKHYAELIGLDKNWKVSDVELLAQGNRVVISLEYVGKKVVCPKCNQSCSKADTGRKRQWRHLNIMEYETRLQAAVPRADCKACGVKTIPVPWSEKYSRFSFKFESYAIEVLQSASSVNRAAKLLGLSWRSIQQIMTRAVDRGLSRREEDEIRYVSIDEKSFAKGQDYISMMIDFDRSRVIEVSKDRTERSCDQLWSRLTPRQKQGIQAISTDFWLPYSKSSKKHAPQAEIVFDRFHVSQYLGEAVDRTRREENKALLQRGDSILTGTRPLWLYNKSNLDKKSFNRIQQVRRRALKTARAWALKEMFREFWLYRSKVWARKFFDKWYSWAIRSRLNKIKKVATMLKKHLTGLLAYFNHPITNSKAEAFNGRVQSIKASARGFRDFANYRIRILFYCGKLDMRPVFTHNN